MDQRLQSQKEGSYKLNLFWLPCV